MVPAGDPPPSRSSPLIPLLKPGDIIIDGGNSNFRDSIARANMLSLTDPLHGRRHVGWHLGPQNGYCMMIGGERDVFDHLRPLFATLAPGEDGYDYFGTHGAGHFTKMVHNGIEYGMMQAYGEGFEIIKNSDYNVDLSRLSTVWNHGSVVRSWLLELAELAFQHEGSASTRSGATSKTPAKAAGPSWRPYPSLYRAPVITLSLMARFVSRPESLSAQVAAALRNQFGGHAVRVSDSIDSRWPPRPEVGRAQHTSYACYKDRNYLRPGRRPGHEHGPGRKRRRADIQTQERS